MDDNSKIIIKSDFLQAGGRALVDFKMLSTVPLARTIVVKKPYKKGVQTFIGIKEGLSPREIIKVGNLGFRYVIIGEIKAVLPYGGYLYRIKRIDGFNITSTDLEAIKVNDVVLIKSRRNFKQLMQY